MAEPDYAALAALLGVALREAGLPTGPDRCERLGRALTVMRASTLVELRACALATMVADPMQIEVLERVLAELFYSAVTPRQPTVVAPQPGMEIDADSAAPAEESSGAGGELPPAQLAQVPSGSGGADDGQDEADQDLPEVPAVRRVASATERLRDRDFNSLSPQELRALARLMRELVIAVPPRRTRRYRPRKDGVRLDMRRTLRQARRTGGEPVQIARRAVRSRPRRLVVLCDISGSMEPYARALLQFMYVSSRTAAVRGLRDASRPRTEVFSFATRLTRLTPTLAAATPETMLAKAGEAAVDWAGGTRIGAAVRDFMDRYGVRGMARGSVILIISDGWETGEVALLGAQMARLRRLAYRVVWANPRTQSERYRPEVGGMAAAWPYCDAVVSAHNFDALDELIAALAAPSSRARAVPPRAPAPDRAGQTQWTQAPWPSANATGRWPSFIIAKQPGP
ncbi:MAG TPA: VWA domain-containing protein [Trebonia sp.]|nr:VWA domain-containing protein [Trebonia sp.]